MNKNNFKYIAIGLISGALFLSYYSGFGASIKLNPIKPPLKQTAALTDEQQGILAVRNAKLAVVSVIGNSQLQDNGQSQQISTVAGSGFVIDPDGLIVSNSHVVADSSLSYTVEFSDGTTYDAKVSGLDKYNDIAILKIDAHNLSSAKLGDSESLETGQTVFAIGNSLGKYQNTVTKGVVSGLGRAVDLGDGATAVPRLQHLIQTDAAINLGNSGGPLINLAGEVVGMDTLIDAGGSSLGFAVPVNTIKDSVQQLKAFGKVSKPYMGISFFTITKAEAALRKLAVSEGAYVNSVAPGGPADAAGIKPGDIITAINRQKLNQANELDTVLSKYQAGAQVLITFLRGSQSQDVPVILQEFKDSTPTLQLGGN